MGNGYEKIWRTKKSTESQIEARNLGTGKSIQKVFKAAISTGNKSPFLKWDRQCFRFRIPPPIVFLTNQVEM
jgi:hypothetical protein